MQGELTRHRLTVLILALMATGIGQSLVFAILAPLGREVELGELQITSIIAVSALIFSLAAQRWGRFSDRVGRKPVIITGLLGYTAGTLLFTSVFSAGIAGALVGWALYATLLAARCSQSLIMSATAPSATAYAADLTAPSQRTRVMARLGTANSLGTILGPAVSGALATFGLLAPLYFASGLALLAAVLVWRQLPSIPPQDRSKHQASGRLRFSDRRILPLLATAIGLFIGFSGIQQTLGFQLQDKLLLTGIQTAQMTGAALMVSAGFTFLVQTTVMQRVKLRPTQFIRLGLISMLLGSGVIAAFQSFAVLSVGMAFLGIGLGLCVPAISAGASLAVSAKEQGAAAGLVSSCPAIGFVAGPICAGALYQLQPSLAALFSTAVFLTVLAALVIGERRQATDGSKR